jgi:hypothetical protein
MPIRAVYELPVHIWVMTDALDTTYPAGLGSLSFNVVMPSSVGPFGGPPSVPGLEEQPELAGPEVTWALEYAAHIPDSYKPATAVHRVAITDVDGPTPAHRPWSMPADQLADYITPWFDSVRTWAEVFTGQDLDPNHRVYDAESIGVGLTFLDASDDPKGLRIMTPRVLPLRAGEWAAILQLVRDGKEPPLEELLSRDARASQRRGADRRAVIEAATALEISLGRFVRDREADLPPRQRERLNDRTALGGYIDIAEQSQLPLEISVERLRWLSSLRNDAAHRGEAPNNWDAGKAVQIAMDFLGAHGRYTRRPERDPDGSEFVLVNDPDGEEPVQA